MAIFEGPIYSLTKELQHMELELAYFQGEVFLTEGWVKYDTAHGRAADPAHVKRLETAKAEISKFEAQIRQYSEAIDLLTKAQDTK